WRGPVLDQYRNGRWSSGWTLPLAMLLPPDLGPDVVRGGGVQRHLFDLGPGQYFLTFEVNVVRAGGLYVSDSAGTQAPRMGRTDTAVVPLMLTRSGAPLFVDFEGSLVPSTRPTRGTARYRQVTLPPPEPDLSPVALVHVDYATFLCRQPVPELTDWTRQL